MPWPRGSLAAGLALLAAAIAGASFVEADVRPSDHPAARGAVEVDAPPLALPQAVIARRTVDRHGRDVVLCIGPQRGPAPPCDGLRLAGNVDAISPKRSYELDGMYDGRALHVREARPAPLPPYEEGPSASDS